MIGGWVKEVMPKGFFLRDFTGDIFVSTEYLGENASEPLAFRMVVLASGVVHCSDEGRLYMTAENIEIVNCCEAESFNKIYVENLTENRIELLRNINKLKGYVRGYLSDHDFIEICTPMLWKSVKEYGMFEWKVINPLTGVDKYRLLQSPNIINLINCISGIERNFQFAKCFRLPQESTHERNDSTVEFTQLAITGAFINNFEGMRIVEGLIKQIASRAFQIDIAAPFPVYDYDELHSKYSTDKPDIRYDDYYMPTLEGIDCKLILIPHLDVNDCVNKYLEGYLALGNHTDVTFFVGSVNEIVEKCCFDKNSFNNKLADVGIYDLHKYSVVIVKNFAEHNMSQLLKRLSVFIEKVKGINKSMYSFFWVENYQYINEDDAGVNGLGQNLFTKRRGYKHSFAFDLIFNGFEIASGSEKVFTEKEFVENLDILSLDKADYAYFIDALKSGVPPLFSIGIGWDRLIWQLFGKACIQDIMLIPFDQEGSCSLWT